MYIWASSKRKEDEEMYWWIAKDIIQSYDVLYSKLKSYNFHFTGKRSNDSLFFTLLLIYVKEEKIYLSMWWRHWSFLQIVSYNCLSAIRDRTFFFKWIRRILSKFKRKNKFPHFLYLLRKSNFPLITFLLITTYYMYFFLNFW